jgi:hypothetical protein
MASKQVGASVSVQPLKRASLISYHLTAWETPAGISQKIHLSIRPYLTEGWILVGQRSHFLEGKDGSYRGVQANRAGYSVAKDGH